MSEPTREQREAVAADLGLAGCNDGNCIIKRPVGLHTNGRCHCLGKQNSTRKLLDALVQSREATQRLIDASEHNHVICPRCGEPGIRWCHGCM